MIPLSAQEELDLAVKMQNGDKEARDKLIRSSLFFVIRFAHNVAGYGLPLEDLIQEGSVGLLKAARKFDISKKCRFITYAGWWVRREMVQALRTKTGVVTIPSHVHYKIRKVRDMTNKWSEAHGSLPTEEDLSQQTGLSSKDINRLSTVSSNLVYLNDLGDKVLDDICEQDMAEVLEHRHISATVASWVDRLKEPEKKVITLRYGFGADDPMTLEAIGQRMGITRERVRQIEAQALKKIRLWATDAYRYTPVKAGP